MRCGLLRVRAQRRVVDVLGPVRGGLRLRGRLDEPDGSRVRRRQLLPHGVGRADAVSSGRVRVDCDADDGRVLGAVCGRLLLRRGVNERDISALPRGLLLSSRRGRADAVRVRRLHDRGPGVAAVLLRDADRGGVNVRICVSIGFDVCAIVALALRLGRQHGDGDGVADTYFVTDADGVNDAAALLLPLARGRLRGADFVDWRARRRAWRARRGGSRLGHRRCGRVAVAARAADCSPARAAVGD